jgi:hypothetical protein
MDTAVYPFFDKERAIDEAKKIAHEYCRHPPNTYQEHDFNGEDGWVFYAEYSTEGDHVIVIEAEMDPEIEIEKQEKANGD